MKKYILKDYEEMSSKAADIVTSQIKNNPNSVLGLATGSTPEGMYKHLVQRHKDGEISFKDIVTFNLDEYYGLSSDHPQSYRYFMEDHLLYHVDIDPDNVHIPDGLTKDIPEMCKNYDQLIEEAGQIDLQILGIGINGHIGFNEPGEKFVKGTHLVDLTDDTLDANSRFFKSDEQVPARAITMGVGSILNAKSIILLASGKNKADAIKMAFEGPITPQVPASILQLHPDVTLIVDEEAGSKIKGEKNE